MNCNVQKKEGWQYRRSLKRSKITSPEISGTSLTFYRLQMDYMVNSEPNTGKGLTLVSFTGMELTLDKKGQFLVLEQVMSLLRHMAFRVEK